MTTREITVAGHAVQIDEAGSGAPLLYLHGFSDIHSAVPGWLPFHDALARRFTLIAPAHPGCAGSAENDDIDIIEDMTFHYLEVMDALGLDSVDVVGVCIGGWFAAELAVRHRERFKKLALIGASGLYVPDRPIADLFMAGQPLDGSINGGLRALLFGDPDGPAATALYPDARGDTDVELLRYQAYRLASRIGFRPPYLYDPRLRERLGRFDRPALAVWGGRDALVPVAHGEAYAAGLADCRLEVVAGAGHNVHIEQPDETAALIATFLAG